MTALGLVLFTVPFAVVSALLAWWLGYAKAERLWRRRALVAEHRVTYTQDILQSLAGELYARRRGALTQAEATAWAAIVDSFKETA